jgi:hypothetical protein
MDAITAFNLAKQENEFESHEFQAVSLYVDKLIATAATMGNRDTICEIPLYVAGVDYFPRNVMCGAIEQRLNTLGYYTLLLSDVAMYISWRFPNQTNDEEEEEFQLQRRSKEPIKLQS